MAILTTPNCADVHWGKHPMRVVQHTKSPFDYQILDADGNEIHYEMPVSSSSDWKTIQDMLEAKGIKDGTCGQTRDGWIMELERQRMKLRFMAQTATIEEI